MLVITIKINTIENVKTFVDLASKTEGEVIVKSGRWVIDGKSILGLMSLNLISPIIVECPDTNIEFNKFLSLLEVK